MSERAKTEEALQRIEDHMAMLPRIADPKLRESLRGLLETVLELHGLALARIAARLVASAEGREIFEKLGRDEQVKAVLLLHGLHPDSAEDRIREILPVLEVRLGVSINLVSVSDGIARVAVGGAADWDSACRQVGAALLDAAPDLDDIAIDKAACDTALAAAG